MGFRSAPLTIINAREIYTRYNRRGYLDFDPTWTYRITWLVAYTIRWTGSPGSLNGNPFQMIAR